MASDAGMVCMICDLSCLSCSREPAWLCFETVEDNLEYMRKKFNFVVPDLQYVSDIDGLVKYCSAKVRLGRICLYCNKQFRSCAAVQQHSRDMFHCRLNVGNINDFFDEFYDYYQWPEGEQGMEVENEDGTTSMTNRQSRHKDN